MVSPSKTYIVSIGRNIGESHSQLPLGKWEEFISATQEIVENAYDSKVYFSGTGYGIYRGLTGDGTDIVSIEDSFSVIFSVPTAHIPSVKTLLASLATRFSQDSIAFTEGDTEFIGG